MLLILVILLSYPCTTKEFAKMKVSVVVILFVTVFSLLLVILNLIVDGVKDGGLSPDNP